MSKSYVFEDVDIDCGWTATVEVIDEGELGTFLGKWMAVDANDTECRSDGDPADCIVRKRVLRWVESIGANVASEHAKMLKRLRGQRALMTAIESTREFTDRPSAKVTQRPDLTNPMQAAAACMAVQFGNPYRTGDLGNDGTNNESPDADWRDPARDGC